MKLKNILTSISFCALAIGTAVGAVSIDAVAKSVNAEEQDQIIFDFSGINTSNTSFNNDDFWQYATLTGNLSNKFSVTDSKLYPATIECKKLFNDNGFLKFGSNNGYGDAQFTFDKDINVTKVTLEGKSGSKLKVMESIDATGTEVLTNSETTFEKATNYVKLTGFGSNNSYKAGRFYLSKITFNCENQKTLQSISVTQKARDLYIGDTITGSDFDVVATYDKGDPVTISNGVNVKLSLAADGSNPLDELKLTNKDTTIYVVYENKVSTAITINAKDAKVANGLQVSVASDYKKEGYYEGDALSTTGITAKIKYSNYPELLEDVDNISIKFVTLGGQEIVDNIITAELIGEGTFSVKAIVTYNGALSNNTDQTGEILIENIKASKNVLTLTWENPEKAMTYFTGDTFSLGDSKLVAKFNNTALKGNPNIKLNNKDLVMTIEGKGVVESPDTYKPTVEDNGKKVTFEYTDATTGIKATSNSATLSVTALATQFVWSNPTLTYFEGDTFDLSKEDMKFVYNKTSLGTNGDVKLYNNDVTIYINGEAVAKNIELTAAHNGAKIALGAENVNNEIIKSQEYTLVVNPIEVKTVTWNNFKTDYFEGASILSAADNIKVEYNNGDIEKVAIANKGTVVTLGGETIDVTTYTLKVADSGKELKATFKSALYDLEITTDPIVINVTEDALNTYNLLTDITTLNYGDEVVIANGTYFLGDFNSSHYYNKVASNNQNSFIEGNVANIRASSEVKIFTVAFSDVENRFALLANDSNAYLSSRNSKNSADESMTLDSLTAFEIVIDEFNVTHINDTTNNRELQYNKSNPRFAFYASTQEDIQVYVKDGNANAEAIQYAKFFHSQLTDFCDNNGANSDVTSITNKWGLLEQKYNELSVEAKKEFSAHETEDNILGQAFRLYKIIVNKYSQGHEEIVNFAIDKDGNKIQLLNNNINTMDSNLLVMIALCCAILGTTLIAIVFLVKRKQSN